MDGYYRNINSIWREMFGKKVIKLSINGNLGCPNRVHGKGGCIFCSVEGSGEFAGNPNLDIKRQMQQQKELLHSKWGEDVFYLAYFQSYTNTYGKIEILDKMYQQALEEEQVVGMSIATRPDCLENNVLTLLEKYNQKTYLLLELGLQTANEKWTSWTRRGYCQDVFLESITLLKERNIPVVIHLLVGLPGQKKEDFFEDISFLNFLKPEGVKFHMLNILKGSQLEEEYRRNPFSLLKEEQYIDWITEGIARLSPDISIHRITGDGPKYLRIAPNWVGNKRKVLNGIHRTFREKELFQGKFYTE